jgi:predicted nucleotidyltransferase component of viral defense system
MTEPSPGRINITAGHVARHTPRSAGAQGRDAALVDIAQDLLLRDLHQQGLLDDLVFKGGTALRKLYAGNQGRFSLDLDFSVAAIGIDPDDILELLSLHVQGLQLGPFRYAITERRGKRHLQMSSTEFGGTDSLVSKLDVSPPPWLRPQRRSWVPMTVHAAYGDPPLPQLPVVRLEENIAEKIARLNRTTPARDMYDLRWVNDTFLRAGHLDTDLVRRLAVLKIWVDNFGLIATTPRGQVEWKPGHEGSVFDLDRWLRHRSSDEFDIEDIGALAVPPPTLPDLAAAVSDGYQFLATLTDDEQQLAHCRGQDRQLALRLLRELPDNNFGDSALR